MAFTIPAFSQPVQILVTALHRIGSVDAEVESSPRDFGNELGITVSMYDPINETRVRFWTLLSRHELKDTAMAPRVIEHFISRATQYTRLNDDVANPFKTVLRETGADSWRRRTSG